MTKEEKIKYSYELMIKNNPDEVIKTLIMQENKIDELNRSYLQEREQRLKAIEYIELKRGKNKSSYDCEILNILRGNDDKSNE